VEKKRGRSLKELAESGKKREDGTEKGPPEAKSPISREKKNKE
jgi:hypothetical protein